MSAEILRRAASLMRERAEAATNGPWIADRRMVVSNPGPTAKYVADCFDEPEASDRDAEHIASWHPAVALAVADLLSRVADDYEIAKHGYWSAVAENIARAYLGEDA